MTTLTSPDGPSEVINARRTESLDAPAILKLVQPSTEQLFGRVNVVNLIEKAVLAVTLSNDKDEVLGHAAFFDYPNATEVDQAEWQAWINTYYDCGKCNPLNTLFMHFFVAKPEYSHGCAREIVRTMYNAVPELHYCYLIVPTGVFPDSSLSEIFKPMTHHENVKGPEGCVLFQCERHEHVPVLHIRQAKVEDHDDLTPIFNRHSDMLSRTYGDYFLAEMIEAQDDILKCIVAETEGTAVGFMSLSSDVNVELLNECFELRPFHGLRVPHPDDDLVPPKTPTPTPPPELAEEEPDKERVASATSVKSTASRVSVKDKKEAAEEGSGDQKVKLGSAGKRVASSRASSRKSSSKVSVKDEDLTVKPKLSDVQLGDSSSSLLSDTSLAESLKSVASMKEGSARSLPAKDSSSDQRIPSRGATPKIPTPQAKLPKRFIPTYKGASNAFCIQLFCIDERFEMRSQDFLPKAFELFPEHEFCVISVPHLVPEMPLLQQFVRVTPRCLSTLAQELYVFSRSGLLRSFTVRPACTSDTSGVESLVKTLDLQENLLTDLAQFNKARRDDDGTPIRSYVADCNGQIVGVAIIRAEEDIEYIRSHYNIEDFVYYNHHCRQDHGHLHHYALNPVFSHYSKHFLKEVLRQAHKTCLYYPVYPPYVDKQVLEKHSLVSAMRDMVPVRARRQITYPLEQLGGNAPSDRVLKKQEHYALNHINRKLTLEPKVTINARIVVVGASDVGVAFLETLAFCPHLRFNNLTMISPHGLPGELPPDELRDQMMASSHCYSQEEYAQMSLRTWVNVVYGKMTAINRKKKHVVVNYSTVVPYDHLVLCTGNQYSVPAPTEADISKLATSNEVPNSPDRRFEGDVPKNVFLINDGYDAAVLLYWVENKFLNTQGKAVVYGDSLDVYCCVQTLITMGVAGDRIVLVLPSTSYQTSCFNNKDVDQTILNSLKEAGVQVHSGYLLAQWNDGKASDTVESASFTSSTKPLRTECSAFFAYFKKSVDYEAFKAINDACLVYDGKLVIDASFHTNDVSIRGAGPLTKFQRSYHADQWSHGNFNSKEVGIQLANTMLSLFDPTLEPEPQPPTDMLKLIPMYRNPKISYAILPGGFHYLHVGKPSLNTPLDALMAQNDYGRELITGTLGGYPEYFRIHVNQYSSVETITCLTKQILPSSNLICLYGLHERYLNNLLSRFDEGLIKDFYRFFNEAWCLAVFHDRFSDFRDEVRELLVMRPAADLEALEEKVRTLIDEDLVLSKAQRKNLAEDYQESGAKRAVETRLLSFLSYNYYHMPMYAKPGMV